MSLEAKATMTIGGITIILSIISSIVAGLWLISWDLSTVHKQVEINHRDIQKLDEKMKEIVKHMIKEKR